MYSVAANRRKRNIVNGSLDVFDILSVTTSAVQSR
jgi:hypothetical protein